MAASHTCWKMFPLTRHSEKRLRIQYDPGIQQWDSEPSTMETKVLPTREERPGLQGQHHHGEMCLYSSPFPVGRKIYSKLLMFKVFHSLRLKIFLFFVFNFCTFPTFYYTTAKFCLGLRSQNCFTFFQNHWGSQRAKAHVGYNVPIVSIQNKNWEFFKNTGMHKHTLY